MKRTMTMSALDALALAVFAMSTLPAEAGRARSGVRNWAVSGEWSPCFCDEVGANPNALYLNRTSAASSCQIRRQIQPRAPVRRRARRRRRSVSAASPASLTDTVSFTVWQKSPPFGGLFVAPTCACTLQRQWSELSALKPHRAIQTQENHPASRFRRARDRRWARCRSSGTSATRLSHLVFKSHPGRGLGADPEEKHEPVCESDTAVVDSLTCLTLTADRRSGRCRGPHPKH